MLDFQPCTLGNRHENARVGAECATLQVNEGRVSGKKKQIAIRIARITGPGKNRQAPLLYLAGGPGQAASDAFASIAPIFTRLLKKRDIILVDQRGTGASSPLECDFPDRMSEGSTEEGQKRTLQKLAACKEKLDIDARDYSTDAYVADLEEVRRELLVDRFHLYGISYGTRVAQRYITLAREHVASAILDGVVPAGVSIGERVMESAEDALNGTLRRCSADEACHSRFGDSVQTLRQVQQAQPRTVTVPHPSTGVPTPVTLEKALILETLRLASYTSETSVLIPLWLHQLQQRSGDSLASFTLLASRSLQRTLNQALNMSVMCTEDIPALKSALNEATQRLKQECAVWTKDTLPPTALQLASNDVPLLLLSGELDPITPPRGAETVQALSSKAQHLIYKGQGHGMVFRGCTPRLLETFLQSPGPLDAQCIEKITPPPFAWSLSGTAP